MSAGARPAWGTCTRGKATTSGPAHRPLSANDRSPERRSAAAESPRFASTEPGSAQSLEALLLGARPAAEAAEGPPAADGPTPDAKAILAAERAARPSLRRNPNAQARPGGGGVAACLGGAC